MGIHGFYPIIAGEEIGDLLDGQDWEWVLGLFHWKVTAIILEKVLF